MAVVPRWDLATLLAAAAGPVVVLADPAVAHRVAQLLPWPQVPDFEHVPDDAATLVAVGGGTLLDAVKIARLDSRPTLSLVAVASLWGSGAEASPVALARVGERKVVRMEPGLLPDARAVLPQFADSLPEALARLGCADAWSHALEGALSPLGDASVRADGAALMAEMLSVGVCADPIWFDLSARACALQARAGVGLVHGIAHVLEGPLQAAEPDFGWGHARLCATFCWPVLHLNQQINDKWPRLAAEFGLDQAAVEATLLALFEPTAYDRALPRLEALWIPVLRDPLSRTNSALVRRGHLAHFVDRLFL
jgi:hypothetical protein